jgi:HAD superfamily hydrolase (TIGR01509 family)
VARTELVIFDCDGVLVDSEVIGCRVEAEELGRVGIGVTAAQILERFTGATAAETFRTLEAEHGLKLPEGFVLRVKNAILAAFTAELRAIEGVAAALERIALPVCVASSSDPARIEHSLKTVGLLERFAPHIFSASAVARGKPAPDLFLHAAARMGVAPAHCVVIEDSLRGVEAGVAAGLRVLGFAGGGHSGLGHGERLRAAGAERVFAQMALLPELIAGAG